MAKRERECQKTAQMIERRAQGNKDKVGRRKEVDNDALRPARRGDGGADVVKSWPDRFQQQVNLDKSMETLELSGNYGDIKICTKRGKKL